jgi:hypothetical protein
VLEQWCGLKSPRSLMFMFKDSLCFHALAMAMSKLCMGATFALTTGCISMALKEKKKAYILMEVD